MKQWEIIKAAQEEGAKIRRGHWRDNQYIKWDCDHWVDEKGMQSNSTPLGGVDWELYKNPIKTFGPDRAMYWLERGKLARRNGWEKGEYIKRYDSSARWRNGLSTKIEFLFINDWHLCDEHGNYVPEPEEAK